MLESTNFECLRILEWSLNFENVIEITWKKNRWIYETIIKKWDRLNDNLITYKYLIGERQS